MAVLFSLVNFVAFALMSLDKLYAKQGGWRILEKTLFAVALLGGAIGGTAGVFFFHHKTCHWYFRYGFPALAVAQVLYAGLLLL